MSIPSHTGLYKVALSSVDTVSYIIFIEWYRDLLLSRLLAFLLFTSGLHCLLNLNSMVVTCHVQNGVPSEPIIQNILRALCEITW